MVWSTILSRAKANCARIAVGVGETYSDKTIRSAELAAAEGYATVTLVSAHPIDSALRTVVSDRPEQALIELLKNKKADGLVRGSLGANSTLKALKATMDIKKVMRVSLLKTPDGKFFFFAPVGVDEGWTIEDKVELGELGVDLIRRFGIEPEVGVMSGARLDDRGRSARVDKSLDDAVAVVKALREKGVHAHDAQILIEDAVNEYQYIIAPDGISGNLVFRALCLVGCGEGYGAPLVGTDVVYVDTSRAGEGYENAICMASALAGKH
jgi:putative methanogen marker protein 4